MKNPFRDRTMRNCYDAAVTMYRARHRNLFYPSGRRCLGSSFATYFWRGYDGVDRNNKFRWDKESRKMVAWAYYRAGEAMKKEDECKTKEPPNKPNVSLETSC